ncbi:MAG: phage portal protein [Rhodobacteraceae bacterium]|nr:phage portal protein [Paracoccaceae bacterium]
MSFISKVLGRDGARLARIEPTMTAAETSGVTKPNGWFADFGNASGSRVKTLPYVSTETAMRHGTVAACCDIIAGDLAKIGLHVYEKDSNGNRKRIDDHPAGWLLNKESSSGVAAVTLRHAMAHGFVLRGNGYGYAPRDGGGQLIMIDHVYHTGLQMLQNGRAHFYDFTDADGVHRRVPSRSMVHVRYASRDGWIGRSPIMESAETLGIALAGQEAAARGVSGAALKAYVTSGPDSWVNEDTAIQQVRAIKEVIQDPTNNGIPIMPVGAEIKKLDLSPADMQLLETRRFDRQQILATYRMPPSKVSIDDAGIKAGVEQQAINYLTDCLLHWATQFERQLEISLLTEAERRAGFTLRHNLDSLLRATAKERNDSLKSAVGGPFMTANEARKTLGHGPVDEGATLYPPSNMTRDEKPPKNEGK